MAVSSVTTYRDHPHTKDLVLTFSAIVAGVPIGGLVAVTATILRSSGGPNLWWNHAGTAWAAAPVANPMAEFDGVNLPGLYTMGPGAAPGAPAAIPAANLTVDDEITIFYTDGGVTPLVEHGQVRIYADNVKNHRVRSHDRTKDLILTFSEVAGTTPLTAGTLPQILIRQPTGPNFYWSGAAWQVAPAWVNMTEVSAANSPGIFDYTMVAADLAAATIGDTLYVSYQNTAGGEAYYEHEQVVLETNVWDELEAAHTDAGSFGESLTDAPGDVWDELEVAHVLAGSFGESLTDAPSDVWDELETAHIGAGSMGQLLTILAGLGHRYTRFENQTYNAAGQLTSMNIWCYNSQANANIGGAGGRLLILTFTATYDAAGQISQVVSL